MIKKAIVTKKAKPGPARKASLKKDVKKPTATFMPRLALNHNQSAL
jgi:hypothetical protein